MVRKNGAPGALLSVPAAIPSRRLAVLGERAEVAHGIPVVLPLLLENCPHAGEDRLLMAGERGFLRGAVSSCAVTPAKKSRTIVCRPARTWRTSSNDSIAAEKTDSW